MAVNTANPYPITELTNIRNEQDSGVIEMMNTKLKFMTRRAKTLMTAGITFGTTGLLASTTGFMTVVGLPATITGISSTGVSAFTQVLTEFAHKTELKYAILKEKSYTISKEFNALLHKANADATIDENEYNSLITKYDEYVQFKNNTDKENKLIYVKAQQPKND